MLCIAEGLHGSSVVCVNAAAPVLDLYRQTPCPDGHHEIDLRLIVALRKPRQFKPGNSHQVVTHDALDEMPGHRRDRFRPVLELFGCNGDRFLQEGVSYKMIAQAEFRGMLLLFKKQLERLHLMNQHRVVQELQRFDNGGVVNGVS